MRPPPQAVAQQAPRAVQAPGQRQTVRRGYPEMAIRLGSTVINCADIDVMTAFWSRALHLSPSSAEPGDEFRVLRGEHGSLSLQRSRTPVSEVARLTGLRAKAVRRHREPGDDYVVMTDPEGNEFCVCAKPEV